MFCQKCLLWTVMMGWVASFAGAAAAADTVVRQFSIGTTSTTVGIAAAGEDVELTGPQALTSDVQATCLCSIRSTAASSSSIRSNLPAIRAF